MTNRILLIALVSLQLAGCDAASTVFDDTLREGFVQQCQQVSEGAGIAAGAVNEACECGADKWLERPVAERTQIDRAAVEEILRTCVGSGESTSPATTGTGNG